MVKVPSPGEFVDNTLLDRILNPITWCCEYYYGKDAMHLRLLSLLSGHLLLLVYKAYERSFITMFMLLVSVSVQWLRASVIRSEWQENNKTGRNVARVTTYHSRMIIIVLTLFIALPNSLVTWSDLFFWIQLVGFVLAFLIPCYLEATDALPPAYHARRSALKFV